MNVRLKNVSDGNFRLARHIDVNLYVRPRIKHGGYSLVVVSQKIGEFRDAFGLNGFENERHDQTLRRSDGQVQQDQELNFRGAHASRVLVSASRRNDFSPDVSLRST